MSDAQVVSPHTLSWQSPAGSLRIFCISGCVWFQLDHKISMHQCVSHSQLRCGMLRRYDTNKTTTATSVESIGVVIFISTVDSLLFTFVTVVHWQSSNVWLARSILPKVHKEPSLDASTHRTPHWTIDVVDGNEGNYGDFDWNIRVVALEHNQNIARGGALFQSHR